MERYYPNYFSYTQSYYEPLDPNGLSQSIYGYDGIASDSEAGLKLERGTEGRTREQQIASHRTDSDASLYIRKDRVWMRGWATKKPASVDLMPVEHSSSDSEGHQRSVRGVLARSPKSQQDFEGTAYNSPFGAQSTLRPERVAESNYNAEKKSQIPKPMKYPLESETSTSGNLRGGNLPTWKGRSRTGPVEYVNDPSSLPTVY
ncbi:unnamed protein product [Protopolystoma xenopodis]|uniref:Uncharacterized protein n=1 Tax=Protopolystoma xenopodis TaxID=117903 RepID=A0A448WIH4_9PLAT|nr:unnamed protein product [Protopolystoma xenopodis]